MTRQKTLLAVLGRGCMMQFARGPWKPTGDFDIWDITPGGAGRPIVLPEKNDGDPNGVIGGGELNLAAAEAMYGLLEPDLTVFAYGNRSPYLKANDYPSESSVMSSLFVEAIYKQTGFVPHVDVFNEEEWNTEGSGTFQETRNILDLASRGNFERVFLVTVLVHMTRVLPMMAKHLDDPELVHLRGKIRPKVSEFVLAEKNPKEYAGRMWEIMESKSYIRNLKREANALENMQKGITQITQLKVPEPVSR